MYAGNERIKFFTSSFMGLFKLIKHTNVHDEWGIYRKTLFDLV